MIRPVLVLSVIAVMLGCASATISVSSQVSPSSVYPNDDGVITITVSSDALQNDVRVNVKSSELALDSTSSELGQVQENGQRSATFKFTAPETAGFYIANFEVAYGTQRTYQSVAVDVIGEPEFSIMGKSPQKIYSGQENSINITVSNTGYRDVTNVILELVVPDYFSVLGTNRKTFSAFGVGDEEVIPFNIFVDREAVPGTYEFALNTIYPGGEDSQAFNIPVIGIPSLEIAGITFDPERVEQSQALTVAVRLENVGTAEAKSVRTSLSSPYVFGQMEDYLGSMDIDDTSSAVFELVSPAAGGNYELDLNITFTDDYGNSYSESRAIAMPVLPSRMDMNGVLYLVILFLTVLLIYVWRMKK